MSGRPAGYVEVGHLRSVLKAYESPSWNEKQRLINAVAERVATVVERLQSEERLAALSQAVEDNPGTVMICDVQGNVEYVNAGFTRLTGYAAEAVIGKNAGLLNAGQQAKEFYASLWETIKSGAQWQGEFINRRKNAELYWERATITPIRNQEGQITHYVKVGEDVTAKRLMEDALKVANGFLQIANRQTDMDSLLREFVAQIRGVTLCSAVGIRLLDKEGRVSRVAADGFNEAFGHPQCQHHVCSRVVDGTTDPGLPCYTRGGSFHANDASAFALLDSSPADSGQDQAPSCIVCSASGYQSMAVTPIRAKDRVLGTMHLADPRPNMLSRARVALFEEVALLLGMAIERVIILDALQTSEATARALLDAPTDSALLVEPDGKIIALNEPQARQWGLRKDELVGRNAFDLLPEDVTRPRRTDLEAVLRSRQRLQLGETQVGDRTYDSYISPIANQEGVVTRAAIYTRDISEIKLTEAELRHAHEQLETLLALSGELVSTIDLQSLLSLILEKLAAVVPYDRAAILTLADNALTVAASSGYSKEADLVALSVAMDDYSAVHEIISTKSPIYIPETACLAESGLTVEEITGLPSAIIGPDTCSWLGVPLLARDGVLGVICLGHHEPHHYDPETQHVVQVFANGAAIAISNAHLYAQAQDAATAEERSRLAHELHDSVTQALFSANLIATALPGAFERDQDEATESLQKLLRLIRGALAQMRTLLLELVPQGLMEEQLSVLLGHLSQAMGAEIGAPVDLHVEGECCLPADQQIALYRIAQEALYNVAKHAEASEVRIELSCGQGRTRLRISDNGNGFGPGSVPASHMGVRIMRTRAESVGAKFRIESRIGHGTQITVTVDAVND